MIQAQSARRDVRALQEFNSEGLQSVKIVARLGGNPIRPVATTGRNRPIPLKNWVRGAAAGCAPVLQNVVYALRYWLRFALPGFHPSVITQELQRGSISGSSAPVASDFGQ